jgi:hypothetical protein
MRSFFLFLFSFFFLDFLNCFFERLSSFLIYHLCFCCFFYYTLDKLFMKQIKHKEVFSPTMSPTKISNSPLLHFSFSFSLPFSSFSCYLFIYLYYCFKKRRNYWYRVNEGRNGKERTERKKVEKMIFSYFTQRELFPHILFSHISLLFIFKRNPFLN